MMRSVASLEYQQVQAAATASRRENRAALAA
jgi:hypothetical protein